MIPDWLEKSNMDYYGYEQLNNDKGYIKYANKSGIIVPGYGIMPKHKRIIYINTNYTEKDELAIFMNIREDGDTRTVFNGIINSLQMLTVILDSIR